MWGVELLLSVIGAAHSGHATCLLSLSLATLKFAAGGSVRSAEIPKVESSSRASTANWAILSRASQHPAHSAPRCHQRGSGIFGGNRAGGGSMPLITDNRSGAAKRRYGPSSASRTAAKSTRFNRGKAAVNKPLPWPCFVCVKEGTIAQEFR
jgi:hypothetical protein